MDSNSANTPETPPTPEGPTAAQKLQAFLDKESIELRLTPPIVRQVEANGLMIDQPQIIANYKKVSTITN